MALRSQLAKQCEEAAALKETLEAECEECRSRKTNLEAQCLAGVIMKAEFEAECAAHKQRLNDYGDKILELEEKLRGGKGKGAEEGNSLEVHSCVYQMNYGDTGAKKPLQEAEPKELRDVPGRDYELSSSGLCSHCGSKRQKLDGRPI